MNTDTLTASRWYEISNVDTIDSPAFIVYPDKVRENIRLAISMAGDATRLRPHVKTHKSAQVSLMMMGEGIKKFKCATIAEAEMLAQCYADDVLFAYQPVGPKLRRFIELIKHYPSVHFSCLVDNATAAAEMSQVAISNNLKLSFFLDINVGMNRTGITPGNAIELYRQCVQLVGLVPRGLHVYDGHLHDKDLELRKKKSNEAFLSIEHLIADLKSEGFSSPVIVAGGSPTFPVHAARKNLECSPGTFVYWDRNYQLSCAEQDFQVAALLVTRVISVPAPNKLCLDAGHKSVASENDIHHRLYFPDEPELKCIGHSEEHLVVEAPVNHTYKVGDVLYAIPFHVCPTAALYERAITVSDNIANGEWRTVARDRKISH